MGTAMGTAMGWGGILLAIITDDRRCLPFIKILSFRMAMGSGVNFHLPSAMSAARAWTCRALSGRLAVFWSRYFCAVWGSMTSTDCWMWCSGMVSFPGVAFVGTIMSCLCPCRVIFAEVPASSLLWVVGAGGGGGFGFVRSELVGLRWSPLGVLGGGWRGV